MARRSKRISSIVDVGKKRCVAFSRLFTPGTARLVPFAVCTLLFSRSMSARSVLRSVSAENLCSRFTLAAAFSASVVPLVCVISPTPPFAKPSVFSPWSRKYVFSRSERS